MQGHTNPPAEYKGRQSGVEDSSAQPHIQPTLTTVRPTPLPQKGPSKIICTGNLAAFHLWLNLNKHTTNAHSAVHYSLHNPRPLVVSILDNFLTHTQT